MKTKSEHKFPQRLRSNIKDVVRLLLEPNKASLCFGGESGNALIYVLIAIVLFAGLSFTLSRQSGTGEANSLSEEQAGLYATQIISYAADAKSAYEKMEFIGAQLDDIDVIPPSDTNFNDAPTINKIYHPDGGGLNMGRIPNGAIDDSAITTGDDPEPGWYLGKTGLNIDWTTPDPDLILTAYGISLPVCNAINKKVNAAFTTPPSMSDSIKETLIQKTVDDVDNYSTGANVTLTTGTGNICVECEDRPSLCVEEGGIYAYYSIVAER